MTIRLATIADLPAIVDIYNDAVADPLRHGRHVVRASPQTVRMMLPSTPTRNSDPGRRRRVGGRVVLAQPLQVWTRRRARDG
jgi:hypothetical protein